MEFFMKKQILSLILGTTILTTSPLFAMWNETPDVSQTPTHKTMAKADEHSPQLLKSGVLHGIPRAFKGFQLSPPSDKPQTISQKEFDAITSSANAGVAYAQRKLGDLYRTGAHITQDQKAPKKIEGISKKVRKPEEIWQNEW